VSLSPSASLPHRPGCRLTNESLVNELRAQCGDVRPLTETDLLLSQGQGLGQEDKKKIAEVSPSPSLPLLTPRQLLDRAVVVAQFKELFGTVSSTDPLQVCPSLPPLLTAVASLMVTVSTLRFSWLSPAEEYLSQWTLHSSVPSPSSAIAPPPRRPATCRSCTASGSRGNLTRLIARQHGSLAGHWTELLGGRTEGVGRVNRGGRRGRSRGSRSSARLRC
jgi:hypothetical protein